MKVSPLRALTPSSEILSIMSSHIVEMKVSPLRALTHQLRVLRKRTQGRNESKPVEGIDT